MPPSTRRKPAAGEPPAAPAAERPGPLLIIDPNALLTLEQARAALRLKKSTIRREVRLGNLRISCRAGRRWILGSWILQWIAGGELPRNPGQANGRPADHPAGPNRPK
jgi:hypothetical protein